MAQYSFSTSEADLIPTIDEFAKSSKKTRSEMIELLLLQAVKVRIKDRKRKNAKEVHT